MKTIALHERKNWAQIMENNKQNTPSGDFAQSL